ncbi:SusE domain-containing protein [Flavobacteriaceae bacterium]|nr:SusE domain-containing protein [Flavobacteriaceae bacterium]MDC1459308.1 SusE domain-containing protein [Flavobacteriaceae bacterium]
MKTILKFSKLLLFTFLIVNISSCEKEDYLIFTAINQKEVKFQNEFQDVYKISQQTSNNISERLVWNAPDFDAPTTVTYVVDISTNSDFSTIDMSSGDTSNNHLGLKVSSMLEFAETLGLDDDPSTTFSDGSPNNTGMVYARVTAYAGTSSSGANQSSTVSKTASMNIEVLENVGACTDAALSNWGLVGSAVNGWGGTNRGFSAGNDVPFLSNGQDGMFRAVTTLYDGEFKIREDNAWGLNYGDNGADGTLEQNGANITISAGHYIIDFDAVNFTITITPAGTVWGVVGSATLNGWGAAEDVKLMPDPCNDGVYVVKDVVLTDGEIKFRQDDAWGVNVGDNGADGTYEANGANISVTAGTYDMTLDTVNGTYTLTVN